MTYCIGWKTKRQVFLICDTSVTTHEKTSATSYSSFGEQQGALGDYTLEESLFKIRPITRNAAIAFAGHINTALKIIQRAKELIMTYELPVKEALQRAINSYKPFSKERSVSFILGLTQENNPYLYSFQSDYDTGLVEQNTVVQIGSMGSYFPNVTEYFINGFCQSGNNKPENILAAITAIIQNYGTHAVLSKMYVGGAFFGLFIDSSGYYWQEDTKYVLYYPGSGNLVLSEIIGVLVRYDMLFVSSSILKGTKIFANQDSIDEYYRKNLLDNVNSIIQTGDAQFYIFMNTAHNMITIVNTSGNMQNEYFKLLSTKNGEWKFAIEDSFQKQLMSFGVEHPSDAMPIKINFVQATNA